MQMMKLTESLKQKFQGSDTYLKNSVTGGGGGDLASDPLCSLSSHSKTIIHKYPNNIDQIFLPMSKSRNSEAKKWKVYYPHFVAQKGIILMNLRKGGIVR